MKTTTLFSGLMAMTILLFAQSTPQAQLTELNAKLSKSPNDIALLYQRADVYDLLNDFERSTRDYKKIVDLYNKKPSDQTIGEFTKSCYRLADDFFYRKSDHAQALKYVNEGLKGAPGLKDLQIIEAVILGSDPVTREQAEAKFKTLTDKYPNDARVSRYYAQFLKDIDPIQAAARFEKVVAANPQDLESLIALGTIYNNEASRLSAEREKSSTNPADYMKKSIQYFEKAQRLNPSDP